MTAERMSKSRFERTARVRGSYRPSPLRIPGTTTQSNPSGHR